MWLVRLEREKTRYKAWHQENLTSTGYAVRIKEYINRQSYQKLGSQTWMSEIDVSEPQ